MSFDDKSDPLTVPQKDALLMSRLVEGDEAAFREIMQLYLPKLVAVAYRILSDREEAEDIAQESLLKLWRFSMQWDGSKGAISTWLYRVASNAAIDRLRKKKDLYMEHPPEQIDHTLSQEDALQEIERQTLIKEALTMLPERQKQALSLCYNAGQTNKQAAEIMDISVKALEALLVRARKGLRDIVMQRSVPPERRSK